MRWVNPLVTNGELHWGLTCQAYNGQALAAAFPAGEHVAAQAFMVGDEAVMLETGGTQGGLPARMSRSLARSSSGITAPEPA